MKTDRELLELAAKAAGYLRAKWSSEGWFYITTMPTGYEDDWELWNPLTDDGDALRLAVQIGHSRGLTIEIGQGGVCVTFDHPHVFSDGWQGPRNSYDPQSTARRAIVTAAAKIGEQMP